MSLASQTTKSQENGSLGDAPVLSIEECRKYLGKFHLSDDEIVKIRNYLAGIIDKTFNLYLDDFR